VLPEQSAPLFWLDYHNPEIIIFVKDKTTLVVRSILDKNNDFRDHMTAKMAALFYRNWLHCFSEKIALLHRNTQAPEIKPFSHFPISP